MCIRDRASTVVLLMQINEAPFRTIVEVRSAMEPMISSLAAVRMNEDDLADLAATIDQMRTCLLYTSRCV